MGDEITHRSAFLDQRRIALNEKFVDLFLIAVHSRIQGLDVCLGSICYDSNFANFEKIGIGEHLLFKILVPFEGLKDDLIGLALDELLKELEVVIQEMLLLS
jgi:hypothetical protein